jgi:hypothetical protein
MTLIGRQAVNDSESPVPQQTWLNYVMEFLAGECLSIPMALLLLAKFTNFYRASIYHNSSAGRDWRRGVWVH